MIVKMAKSLGDGEEVELRKIVEFFEDIEGVSIDRVRLVGMLEKKGVVRSVKEMRGDVLKETLMMVRPA
mgnify:CR=1 FL=1